MSTEVARTILLVEDDEALRQRMAKAFAARGWEVWPAANGEDALARVITETPEYAVVDLRMPGVSGLDVVAHLHEADPATTIVVLTGYGSIATALEAVRVGATHYLTKPADVEDILAAFERRASAPAEARSRSGSEAPVEVPSLARVEWEHINRVLTDCAGNISQAARLLGIHRRSLQRKLSKYPTVR